VPRSQKGIQEAERLAEEATETKPVKAAAAVSSPTALRLPWPKSPQRPRTRKPPWNIIAKGLTAIRSKDFHRAVEELEIASQLDPTDERIYVARERAKQEWASASTNKGTP